MENEEDGTASIEWLMSNSSERPHPTLSSIEERDEINCAFFPFSLIKEKVGMRSATEKHQQSRDDKGVIHQIKKDPSREGSF